MREIKFRAWYLPRSQMIDKFLIGSQGLSFIVEAPRGDISVGELKGLPSNDVVIMQYTGLRDKNGREIYEGDILSGGHIVEWHSDYDWPGFYTSHNNWDHIAFPNDSEVIGNIYENPEMVR